MKVRYKNNTLERVLTAITFLTAVLVAATFVLLYGFDAPLMSPRMLHYIQIAAFLVFLGEKTSVF